MSQLFVWLFLGSTLTTFSLGENPLTCSDWADEVRKCYDDTISFPLIDNAVFKPYSLEESKVPRFCANAKLFLQCVEPHLLSSLNFNIQYNSTVPCSQITVRELTQFMLNLYQRCSVSYRQFIETYDCMRAAGYGDVRNMGYCASEANRQMQWIGLRRSRGDMRNEMCDFRYLVGACAVNESATECGPDAGLLMSRLLTTTSTYQSNFHPYCNWGIQFSENSENQVSKSKVYYRAAKLYQRV